MPSLVFGLHPDVLQVAPSLSPHGSLRGAHGGTARTSEVFVPETRLG